MSVLQAGVRGQGVVVVVRLVGKGVISGHCGGSRKEGCIVIFLFWMDARNFATLRREGRSHCKYKYELGLVYF